MGAIKLSAYLREVLFAVDDSFTVNYASPQTSLITGKKSSESIGTLCYEEFIGRSEPCKGCPVSQNTDGGRLQHDVISHGGCRHFFDAHIQKAKGGLYVESLYDISALLKENSLYKHEVKRLKALQVKEQLQNHEIKHNYDFLMDVVNRTSYGLMVANPVSCRILIMNDMLRRSTGAGADAEKDWRCYEVYGKNEPCEDCPHITGEMVRSRREFGELSYTVTFEKYQDYIVESVRDTTREIRLINEIQRSQNEVNEKQRQMELLNKDLLRMNDDLKKAQKMIDMELQQVGDLQMSLLPKELPDIDGYELAAFYVPAEHAGGDYYDCIEMSNNHWGFTIADVSGHGTPAAVIMAMARSIMRSYTYDIVSSSEALSMVNEILCDNVYTNDFVTMFYSVFNTVTGEFNFASAGHNPMLHFDKSEMMVRPLTAEGLFLAVFPEVNFEEKNLKMNKGDILFMYTDGLVEAMNPRKEQYGMDRVISHLIMYSEYGCETIVNEIMDDVKRFAENTPFDDDITILVVKKTK